MKEVTGPPHIAPQVPAQPDAATPDVGEVPGDAPGAFDEALSERTPLLESRQPETREAVKRSLSRFESSPADPPHSRSPEAGPSTATGRAESRDVAATARRADPPQPTTQRAAARPARSRAETATEHAPAARPRPSNPDRTVARPPVTTTVRPPPAEAVVRRAPVAPGPADTARAAAPAAGEREPGPLGLAAGDASATAARTTPNPAVASPRTSAAGERPTDASVDAVARQIAQRVRAAADGAGRDVAAPVPLDAPALGGASIRLDREGGALKVIVTTPTERAARFVEEHAGELETAVAAVLGEQAVQVAVADRVPEAAPATPASAPPELDAAVRQVAERVLVSAPASGGAGEVRITLNQSVLDGSEVRIRRDEDGALTVVFVAQTDRSERVLDDHRAQIQRTLGERLPGERVQVEVDVPRRAPAARDDADGRSRQRYVAQDDEDETP